MSSKLYDKALQLRPKTSLTLAVLVVVLCTAASLSVIAIIPVTHPALLLLIPIFIFRTYYYFKQNILLSADNSVICISQSIAGDWSLGLHDHSELPVELCDDSYIHPMLVILNFKVSGRYRRISLPLFKDALNEEQHRQLRCQLRLSRPAEQEKLLRR